ncbi:hypothetical protein COV24_01705 [candidate division WWE3 bacterium CG10_big_fil_rev_8_21_14_0_10_32_10]|uniref:Uncharacterized protein n=1 Tax=candidate division WWE3 bacterium CG10_big_fil_rev_8_21_14_0_10_32_10 TaxID=1975090 RepID=A0A2H0RCS9_UNCKA|nr:MAG: hypothetical protein COV24_01705 [candidate division WWE3 bacterium CG10_big_fil_rev_8_21_14_0_10_32_10]
MNNLEKQYKYAIEYLISKQIKLLGKQIVFGKIKKLRGLHVDNKGKITSITGDSTKILQTFIADYSKLSGLVFKNTMRTVLEKYPDLPIYIN